MEYLAFHVTMPTAMAITYISTDVLCSLLLFYKVCRVLHKRLPDLLIVPLSFSSHQYYATIQTIITSLENFRRTYIWCLTSLTAIISVLYGRSIIINILLFRLLALFPCYRVFISTLALGTITSFSQLMNDAGENMPLNKTEECPLKYNLLQIEYKQLERFLSSTTPTTTTTTTTTTRMEHQKILVTRCGKIFDFCECCTQNTTICNCVLERIKTLVNNNLQSSTECVISHEKFDDDSKLAILPCGHFAEYNSTLRWLSQDKPCFLCRSNKTNYLCESKRASSLSSSFEINRTGDSILGGEFSIG